MLYNYVISVCMEDLGAYLLLNLVAFRKAGEKQTRHTHTRLVASGSPFTRDHFWKYFSEMAYILPALLHSNRQPKHFYTIYQLFLPSGFNLSPDELFELMPEVLDWVAIGRLSWCTPPVDSIIMKEPLSKPIILCQQW